MDPGLRLMSPTFDNSPRGVIIDTAYTTPYSVKCVACGAQCALIALCKTDYELEFDHTETNSLVLENDAIRWNAPPADLGAPNALSDWILWAIRLLYVP